MHPVPYRGQAGTSDVPLSVEEVWRPECRNVPWHGPGMIAAPVLGYSRPRSGTPVHMGNLPECRGLLAIEIVTPLCKQRVGETLCRSNGLPICFDLVVESAQHLRNRFLVGQRRYQHAQAS